MVVYTPHDLLLIADRHSARGIECDSSADLGYAMIGGSRTNEYIIKRLRRGLHRMLTTTSKQSCKAAAPKGPAFCFLNCLSWFCYITQYVITEPATLPLPLDCCAVRVEVGRAAALRHAPC